MKLTSIILKNIKLIVRSKTSALVVLLGPLFLVMLVGAAFNTANIYGIRVGTYSESYSDETNSLISSLVQKQYNVIKADSKDTCIKGVVQSQGEILFYVDNSRANLVYVLIENIMEQVGAKSEEISLALTSKLISVLGEVNNDASDVHGAVSTLDSNVKQSSSQVSEITLSLGKVDLTSDMNEFGFSAIYSAISQYQ
ncbi:hypothetical protein HYT58_01585, partial [Candidatus Woesearchaeota archaeon]|nr:hypothetical protein [Candidatus Woesearchaeota archaeon]